jgi:hypothetical protein
MASGKADADWNIESSLIGFHQSLADGMCALVCHVFKHRSYKAARVPMNISLETPWLP